MNLDTISQYLKGNPKTYPFYDAAVKLAEKLRVHVDGAFPVGLTEKLRPHETAVQQEYRKNNFKAITKPAVNSIVVSIRKINKADDFQFTYPDMPARVAEEKSLKTYLEEDFPFDNSLRNWLFKLRLFDLLGDPNGVVVVLPSNKPANEAEFVNPYPYFFPSERVLDFVEGHLCVVESDQKSLLTGQNASNATGRILWLVDTDAMTKATQVGDAQQNRYELEVYNHFAIGWLPAFKMAGGKVCSARENGQRLHESIIHPCLDYFDLALERQSDFQIQLVYHVHSEAWEYTVNKCTACMHTGKEMVDGKSVTCRTCNGSKWVSPGTTPLGITRFTPDANTIGGQERPGISPPHKGYIEKPLPPTELLKQQVKDDILSGMEALNVEYAKSTPLTISGEAKKVDRQEVNGFYSDIAQHLVENILRPVVYYIACMRYGMLLGQAAIDDIIPNIPVPQEFDTSSVDEMALQVKEAVEAEMDASIVFERQRQYAAKAFGKDSMQYKMVTVASQHDPLPFKTEDDRMTVLANGGCSQSDYILSAKFNYFVTVVSEKDEAFFDKSFDEQKKALFAIVDQEAAEQEAKKAEEQQKQADQLLAMKQTLPPQLPKPIPAKAA